MCIYYCFFFSIIWIIVISPQQWRSVVRWSGTTMTVKESVGAIVSSGEEGARRRCRHHRRRRRERQTDSCLPSSLLLTITYTRPWIYIGHWPWPITSLLHIHTHTHIYTTHTHAHKETAKRKQNGDLYVVRGVGQRR